MVKLKENPFRVVTTSVPYEGLEVVLRLETGWQTPLLPQDGSKPSSHGEFKGRVTPSGSGFLAKGRLASDLRIPCNRCLAETPFSLGSEVTHYYTPVKEEADDGVGVTALEGDQLDLEPVLAEEFVLALPSYLLCQEDCKGLCVQCGAELNVGKCACEPILDPRWDKLKNLKIGG